MYTYNGYVMLDAWRQLYVDVQRIIRTLQSSPE